MSDVHRITAAFEALGIPAPHYGEPNERAFQKLADGIEALIKKLTELSIAANGYRLASGPTPIDDQLIEQGGGYDLWLGRLLNALSKVDK